MLQWEILLLGEIVNKHPLRVFLRTTLVIAMFL